MKKEKHVMNDSSCGDIELLRKEALELIMKLDEEKISAAIKDFMEGKY